MKRITWSILGLALVLLAGCVVTSVYPYYNTKDLTFDPALVGTWHEADKTNTDKDSWTFEKIADQTYKLTVRDGSETNEFDAHLFKLRGEQFLDCLPRQRAPYNTPAHVLLRVKSIQPQLEMYLLNYDWLTKLVEASPKTIRHTVVPNPAGDSKDDGLLTLTADTAELQKFILKQLKTKEAWSDPMVMQKP